MESEAEPEESRGVPISPVPTSFTVGTVANREGGSLVVLQCRTPVGMAAYFLEPGLAVQIGNGLRRAGKASASPPTPSPSGLVVPGR